MKKTLLGLAVACLTFACASQQKSAVGEANTAPNAACDPSHCEKASADCCANKGACPEAAKADCSGKVCPVTGKPQG